MVVSCNSFTSSSELLLSDSHRQTRFVMEDASNAEIKEQVVLATPF